jgi:anaerobic selenocysteine-containing dehydrogenase
MGCGRNRTTQSEAGFATNREADSVIAANRGAARKYEMAVAPAGEDNYPEPVVSRGASNGAMWRVVGLSIVFISIAVAFALMGEAAPADMVLIGRRQLRSNNSWMHNLPTMVKGSNRCTLMLNVADAERLGIVDGDTVRLRSRVGEIDASTGDAEAARAAVSATIPLRRYGDPEEFGRVAAFVLSPAASFISGVMLPVDGGLLRAL